MTHTDVREALLDVRESIRIPAPDAVAFRARVRSARRRRAGGRALAAASVAAVVVGAVTWSVRPVGEAPTDGSTQVPAVRPPHPASAPQLFPMALEGRLTINLPDGSGFGARVGAQEVLGNGAAGTVVVGHDRHLLLVPLAPDGQPLGPVDLGHAARVKRAWLDKAGVTAGFVTLDGNRLHLRSVTSGADLVPAVELGPSESLLAVDGTRWLSGEPGGDRVTLHDGARSTDLAAGSTVLGAQLAGDTVAITTPEGVELFDASSGRALGHADGLSIGSLSPDGRWYAAAPGAQELDAGASPDWYLVDARTGERSVYAGRPARARATAMTWQDTDRFLVVATDPRQPGNRIVSDCSMATQRCSERYNDAGDTLEVASR